VPRSAFGPAIGRNIQRAVDEIAAGVRAGADAYTAGTTFQVVRSMRLDLGYGSHVHRDRSEAMVHALIA
jgi:hypothetical protein